MLKVDLRHGNTVLSSTPSSLFQKLVGNAYIMLSMAMVLWACNTVAARLAVGNISPMLLVLLRWILACGVLVIIAREALKADWPLLKPRLPYVFVMGALGYTAFNALFYVAGHYTTAINIGILQGSMPILVLVTGALALRETATPLQWLGMISYSLYLSHNIVAGSAYWALGTLMPGGVAAESVQLVLVTALSLLFAYALWWVVERPAHDFAKRVGARLRV